MRREGVEVGDPSSAREQRQHEPEEHPPTTVEEVRVVEVDVDEVGQHAGAEGTCEIAERVRRRNGAQRFS